ncbi:MAG: YARHG domain-containing protein [Bacteroidales bacterium]|nr:YARHG domain-containing protein [Bacteroidales bacterium]
MKIKLILLIMVLTTISAAAQTPRQQTIANLFGRLDLTEDNHYEVNYWTDGSASYRPFFYDLRDFDAAFRSDGNTIYFVGGTLHEGGIGHEVLLDADGRMTTAGSDYGPFKKGDIVEYRIVGEQPLLIFSDLRTKAVKDVWKKMEGGDLRALYLNNYLRYGLAGTYSSAADKTITFHTDKCCVSGLWDTSDCAEFTFGEEYESPVLTIVHSNKDRAYVVRKTLTGLELFPAKFSAEDNWWEEDESQPSIALVKTAEAWSNLPLEEKQGVCGRFTLASEQVMTKEELQLYAGYPALPNLKIMRNEIFARYGYKFKTADMANYFGAKEWYIPQYDDVTSHLTEIERINIAQIQVLESTIKD